MAGNVRTPSGGPTHRLDRVRPDPRLPSPAIRALIDANAPLWAGEAEVFRTYWDSPRRSVETDCRWLARQCFHELFGGFLPRLRELSDRFPAIELGDGRATVLGSAQATYEQLAHYCAFAQAYDSLRGPRPPLSLAAMKDDGDWDENVDLALACARHRWEFGEVATLAEAFTAEGYCTLYSEGLALAGRGGADDLIAEACAQVHDQKRDRMIAAVIQLEDRGLEPEGFDRIIELSVEQMKLRIRMRNAQFGFPLSHGRLQAIDGGDVDPLTFDYARAGFVLA